MKKRDLEKKLSELGWYFLRFGSGHDIWTNGKEVEAVGRHKEINEFTAKAIIRRATRNPGTKKPE
jgi:hypothetical protein